MEGVGLAWWIYGYANSLSLDPPNVRLGEAGAKNIPMPGLCSHWLIGGSQCIKQNHLEVLVGVHAPVPHNGSSRMYWVNIFGTGLRQLCVLQTPKWLSCRLKFENHWIRDQMGQNLQVSSVKYLLSGWLEAGIRHRIISVRLRGLATTKYFMTHRMMKWFGTSHWIKK